MFIITKSPRVYYLQKKKKKHGSKVNQISMKMIHN